MAGGGGGRQQGRAKTLLLHWSSLPFLRNFTEKSPMLENVQCTCIPSSGAPGLLGSLSVSVSLSQKAEW